MTSLLPIGGAAIGAVALNALTSARTGEFLRQLLPGNNAKSETVDHSKTAVKPPFDLSTAIPAFAEKIRSKLAATGTDLGPGVTLKPDGRGGVIVDGDHPDRLMIEDLLDRDPQLQSEFNAICTAAAQEREQFSIPAGESISDFRLWVSQHSSATVFE